MTTRGSSSITCHVMSSVRMEYGLCVSSSRSHEEYASTRLDSLHQQHKPNLTPMQWLVVVVVR